MNLVSQLGASPGYSYVARARPGTSIYTAGAVPLDRDGELVGVGDLHAQTVAVVDNLRVALTAAGADGDAVVKTTVYVVAREQGDLGEVWRVFSQTPLASAPSTLVGVTALGYEGQLVEIEAVAVIE
jgi:enamine deaminase RidA (YjgF/YER057c/UK114 family)